MGYYTKRVAKFKEWKTRKLDKSHSHFIYISRARLVPGIMVSEENQVIQLQVENKRIKEKLVRVQQENSELIKQCESHRRFMLHLCKTIEEKVVRLLYCFLIQNNKHKC